MERKEKGMNAHEQRLSRALKTARVGWWEYNMQSSELYLSDAVYAILGISQSVQAQDIPSIFPSLVHAEDLPCLEKAMRSLWKQSYFELEHRAIKPTGETIHLIHYVQSEQIEGIDAFLIHGVTKDISSRKRAEEALVASQQRMHHILESIGDSFYAIDKEGVITYWNEKAEKVLHRKKEDVIGKNLWVEFPEAAALAFYTEYGHAMRENIPVHFEAYYPPIDTWFEVSAYPFNNELAVYFRNINEKIKQQKALQQSEERFRYVLKATTEAIWDYDLNEATLFWGEGLEMVLGYALPESQHLNKAYWFNLIHPDDREGVLNSLHEVMACKGRHWIKEYRIQKADKTYAYICNSAYLIQDMDGVVIRIVGAIRDVTIQKKFEKAIRDSEARFKLIFNLSPKPNWIFNAATLRITEANEAAIGLYGYTKEEFLRLKVTELIHPSDLDNMRKSKLILLDQYHDTVRHVNKAGQTIYIEIHTHVIDLPSGKNYIVLGDDLTEKLQLQQRLITEKVAAQKQIGQAIIHAQEKERSEIGKELHDNVNQLLTTAKLYVENINYYPDQSGMFIERGIALLQNAIREIRFLSKRLVTPVFSDIGFRASLDELIEHYRSLHAFEIQLQYGLLEFDVETELKLTLYRILQEQLNNIIKYAQASRVFIAVLQSNGQIVLRVEDDGVGFDVDQVSDGLGLKNIKNRTDTYYGKVILMTAPGKGCKLEVRFPILHP